MQYKRLTPDAITADFLCGFERHQEVKKCWRKIQGERTLQPIAFTENWDAEELRKISLRLKQAAASGAVFAAFPDSSSHPAAFAAVDGEPIGSRGQYLVLHELYTDARYRSQGQNYSAWPAHMPGSAALKNYTYQPIHRKNHSVFTGGRAVLMQRKLILIYMNWNHATAIWK